jgi:germination protein YpeB
MGKNIAIVLLSIAVLILGIWGVGQNTESMTYKSIYENSCEDCFLDLQEALKNMESSLSKALVASEDNYMKTVLLDVWRYSIIGVGSVNGLPISHVSLKESSEIMNQTGDYAYYLASKIDNGEGITQEDLDNLSALREGVYTMKMNITSLSEKVRNGEISLARTDSKDEFYYDDSGEYGTDSAFTNIDKESMEYPKLIYDGPFSEGVRERGPAAELGEKISKEEAKSIAAKFLNSDSAALLEGGQTEGTIPCYVFEVDGSEEGGEYLSIKISVEGGHVIQMTSNREIGEQAMEIEKAQKAAEEFLIKNGVEDMTPSYYETYGNKTVFNFVLEQDETLFYPDMIKVQVALDDGQIVGYEASGYFMAHYDRSIAPASVTMAEAEQKVNQKLNITSRRLALIPLEGTKEALCYEFKGNTENDEWYIVYINAYTGNQQNILKIIEADESVLTL